MPVTRSYQKKISKRLTDPLQEKAAFKKLQGHFPKLFKKVFPGKLTSKSVVIIPSLTLDEEILSKISGIIHYEERLLCLLMLLRMPRTHVVYVTSTPVDPSIIDYYLQMLPGITRNHAMQRLTLLSCYDASPQSLTQKILARPRVIERIRSSIPRGNIAHMACFTVTELERSLAVQLNMPIYGCDPDLYHHGNKSNSRKIFRACGLQVPEGYEHLQNEAEVIHALASLKRTYPDLRRAVIKLNEGFSGEGNAVYEYNHHADNNTEAAIARHLPQSLHIVAEGVRYKTFMQKFEWMGGVVEEYIEGRPVASPSVQCRINPLGDCKVISTHDQVIGGESSQVFLGAGFPAKKEYAVEIGAQGLKVAHALSHLGVLGRFGVDFISVKEGSKWRHYAIEINLRKGGTTHPYIMLQFLTDGDYDYKKGIYHTANGQQRYYYCSDNLCSEKYKNLTPPDLVDVAMMNGLHYDGSKQEGVMFHMIGALSQFGKLGVVCIAGSPQMARKLYRQTVKVLDKECR